MKSFRALYLLLLGVLTLPIYAADAPRDGQHDWDTFFGNWKMHLHKRLRPLTGSNDWVDFECHDRTRKVWDGRANLDELEGDGPAGHIEGMTLRLYDRQNQLWRIYWVNSANPTVDVPMIGRYTNGEGEFFDQELFNGQRIFVRFHWTNVSDHSGNFEQAFSTDGGKTWEPNWLTTMEREATPPSNVPPNPETHDGQHDFDFEYGKWHGHLKRLAKPLSGEIEWKEYDGDVSVSKIWNGRANIAELKMKGGGSEMEGLSLRLFDPKTRQWTLWWANANNGSLDQTPLAGAFHDGRGEFYGQTEIGGRWVLVRFLFSGLTETSEHVEQAFSFDGKTWEVNWVADFAKVKETQ